MTSQNAALITLVSCCVGGWLGSIARRRLPEDHLREDSRDVIKTASAMIATLVALVIGLLVGSAKSAYDQAGTSMTQIGARVIVLDRVLSRYGPETGEIRRRIREGITRSIDDLWPAQGRNPSLAAVEQARGMDEVHDLLVQLAPRDERHQILRANALATWADLSQARWLIIEQAQNTLPDAFLALLVFWLSVLFASLGVLAPRNLTVAACLLICAASMAGAIYVILEMNRPLEGAVQISPAPLRKALSVLAKEA